MQIEEIQPAVVAGLQIDAIRANGDHLLAQKPGLAYQYIKVQKTPDLLLVEWLKLSQICRSPSMSCHVMIVKPKQLVKSRKLMKVI